jgi:hypothetical protein
MSKKQLSHEVEFAKMQLAHDCNVIEKFNENPSESVASVTLEVGGVEYIILIHDEDYPSFSSLLLEFNRAENERLERMLNKLDHCAA